MPSRTLTIEIKILEVKFSFTANTKLVCRKGVLVISTLLASSVCWVNDVAFGCYIYFLSPLRVQKTTPQFAKFNFPFVNPISSGKGSVPFWFFFSFCWGETTWKAASLLPRWSMRVWGNYFSLSLHVYILSFKTTQKPSIDWHTWFISMVCSFSWICAEIAVILLLFHSSNQCLQITDIPFPKPIRENIKKVSTFKI